MAESRSHKSTAIRLAELHNSAYNPGPGADIKTEDITIEVETADTVADAGRQLGGHRGPVFVGLHRRRKRCVSPWNATRIPPSALMDKTGQGDQEVDPEAVACAVAQKGISHCWMAWVEAPRAVSSTARPTRPPCDVLRPSRPAAAQAAVNRRLIWSTLRPTTESPGSGETAACRAAVPRPRGRRPDAARRHAPPVGSDFERRTVTCDVVAVSEIDVGPAERGDLAATKGAVEQQSDDRTVDQAAVLGGLRALEAAAGAARAEAGGEDGGALVGGEVSRATTPDHDRIPVGCVVREP